MSIARARIVIGSLYGLMRNALGLNVATPLESQELSCTVAPDRRLVVLGHEPIAGFARDHGTVADDAAMLALHTLDSATLLAEPTFVAPGDSCLRTDDPGWRWHCIAGHGTTLADWERRPLASKVAALEVELGTKVGSAVIDGFQAQLDGMAPLGSPALIGSPTCPTPENPTGIANKAYVDSVVGGSPSPAAWALVEVVEVASAVASVELPSSGALDPDYEYRIEHYGWTLAAAANVSAQVDVGTGYITGAVYSRSTSYIAAGSTSSADVNFNASTVMLLSTGNADYPLSGEIIFAPGHQSTGYSEVRNSALYRNSNGRTVHFTGRNWLTTPTNAAIQRIRLMASTQDTTAGVFALSRRPLVA